MLTIFLLLMTLPDASEPQILKFGKVDPLVTYAYELSGRDMDFVLTVERESGFSPKALGDGGTSKGLCQWHKKPHIWNDEGFKDPYWQVEKCLWTYSTYMANDDMHKLSGYKVRNTVRDRFSFE